MKKLLRNLFFLAMAIAIFMFAYSVLSAHPRHGEVLLSYEMDSKNVVEIQLKNGDAYDTLYFLELTPLWNGSPFFKVVTEHTYRLKTAGVSSYSTKAEHQDQGGIICPHQFGANFDAPTITNGLHIVYDFMPIRNQLAAKKPSWGYIYAGVTTDPSLMSDNRIFLIRRLDSSFYVYLLLAFEYSN